MTAEVVNGLFALGGALLGVFGTWWVAHRFRERKRIEVTTSPLAQLLDVGDDVKSDIKILFRDKPIEALSLGEICIQNTGTSPVESIDITVAAQPESALLEFSIASANFSIGDDAIILSGDESSRAVAIDFLNSRDRLVLSYKLAGKRRRPDVTVRKLGVEIVAKRDLVNWIPDLYAEVVYEMFSQVPFFNLVGRMVKPYRLYLEARRAGKVRQRLVSGRKKGQQPNAGDSL